MLVAVDFPAGGFAKISDFFPCDLSKWNLGKNFRFVKFKIFEWKLVLPLIFADDFFEIFHSVIFKNSPGGISFSDKLGGIAVDFFWIFSGKKENSTPDFARVGEITPLGANLVEVYREFWLTTQFTLIFYSFLLTYKLDETSIRSS